MLFSLHEAIDRSLQLDDGAEVTSLEASVISAGIGTVGFWANEYLQAVTFSMPETFGCDFSPVKHNTGNTVMNILVLAFRLFVSVFAIGVYLLPLQRLFFPA